MSTQTANRMQAGPPKVDAKAIDNLDHLASECRAIAFPENVVGQFSRAFAVADGIKRLKAALTPQVMEAVVALQGTSLGFKTDKDGKGGYSVDVIRDCLIEAVLRGAYPVNNEFNIISERPYLALNFFRRALREFPGLTDLKLMPGVPGIKDGGALVPYTATAKLHGQPRTWERIAKTVDGQLIDNRIVVRVNAGMGADAILGKAERKFRAFIYADLTNSDMPPEGEIECEAATGQAIASSPPTGRQSIKNGNGNGTPATLPKPAVVVQEQAPLAEGEVDPAEELRERVREAGRALKFTPEKWSNLLSFFQVRTIDRLTAQQCESMLLQLDEMRERDEQGGEDRSNF